MARKRFGQHFLHQPATIERVLDAIDPQPGQHLVEIGPGEGALTRALLARVGAVTAIELDTELAEGLAGLARPDQRLAVHTGDALAFDFTALARDEGLRLVGNLPYNVSTPLLFHVLEHRAAVADMHFMLQREVVDRLAAEAGAKTYGRLSVMIQAYCHVEALFRVAPGAFRPSPAVESAVVRLRPRRDPLVDAAAADRFAELVRIAFQGRRKTLRKALAGWVPPTAYPAAGVDAGDRPDQIPPSAYAALARTMVSGS